MARKLYTMLKNNIAGVSSACATVWGANPSGLDLISNNPLPNTPGLSSFVQLQNDGYNILTF